MRSTKGPLFFSFCEGLVSHCPSGHSLNPPLTANVNVQKLKFIYTLLVTCQKMHRKTAKIICDYFSMKSPYNYMATMYITITLATRLMCNVGTSISVILHEEVC